MSNERQYYDALKTIAKGYDSSDRLRRDSQKAFGLEFAEALEYAYDNIQSLAALAIKGKKRPKE